jgi:hypothetical protein
MTVRFTPQGCKVETTCIIQPNGQYTEQIVLSVDPASRLSLAVEESAGRPIDYQATVTNLVPRVRR